MGLDHVLAHRPQPFGERLINGIGPELGWKALGREFRLFIGKMRNVFVLEVDTTDVGEQQAERRSYIRAGASLRGFSPMAASMIVGPLRRSAPFPEGPFYLQSYLPSGPQQHQGSSHSGGCCPLLVAAQLGCERRVGNLGLRVGGTSAIASYQVWVLPTYLSEPRHAKRDADHSSP